MFQGLKDSFTSGLAKSMVATRLERYGKVTDLRINSRDKTIAVEIQLEGEELPVSVSIDRYRVIEQEDGHAVVAEAVTASRPWLKNLLEDLVVEKPLAVPSMVLLALGKPEAKREAEAKSEA